MNIACNDDSGLDVTATVLNDEQIHVNFRFNKDDAEDVNINYTFTKDELLTLKDVIDNLVG